MSIPPFDAGPAHARRDPGPSEGDPTAGHGELVLVTEDDPLLRNLLGAVLEEAGYRAHVATHGQEALEFAAREGTRIALLVTDVVLPDIDGFELVRRLHDSLPGLRVLLTSGHGAEELARREGGPLRHPVLEKPYDIDALLLEIRRTLDRPPDAG